MAFLCFTVCNLVRRSLRQIASPNSRLDFCLSAIFFACHNAFLYLFGNGKTKQTPFWCLHFLYRQWNNIYLFWLFWLFLLLSLLRLLLLLLFWLFLSLLLLLLLFWFWLFWLFLLYSLLFIFFTSAFKNSFSILSQTIHTRKKRWWICY